MLNLQHKDWISAFIALTPFILIAAPLFINFGLTQETDQDYGMNRRRSASYAAASEILLLGAVASGIEYMQAQGFPLVFMTLMPFILVSAVIFIYLGLTEKSRKKIGSLRAAD